MPVCWAFPGFPEAVEGVCARLAPCIGSPIMDDLRCLHSSPQQKGQAMPSPVPAGALGPPGHQAT